MAIGYIAATIAPIQLQTSEMLARTQPNVFDLIIAIASAAVAMLSLRYERLSESVAGVAIAAALLPPMVLIGIQIAYGRWDYAQGSAVLCITNLLAIIFIGVVMMVMYGFSSQAERHWSTVRLFTAMTFMLVIISIPLFNSLIQIASSYVIESKVQEQLQVSISQLQPNAQVQEIDVRFPVNEPVYITSSLRLPEGDVFFEDTLQILEDQMVDTVGAPVQIDLDIIRSVSAVSRDQLAAQQEPTIEQKVQRGFSSYFTQVFDQEDVRLVSWDMQDMTLSVVTYISDASDVSADFRKLESILQKQVDEQLSIDPVIIRDPQLQTPVLTDDQTLRDLLYTSLLEKSGFSIVSLDVYGKEVRILIQTDQPDQSRTDIEQTIQQIDTQLSLTLYNL